MTLLEGLQNQWHPQLERCGYVSEDGATIVIVSNESPEPNDSFWLLEASIPESAKYLWHTHPRGIANLSYQDYQLIKEYLKPHIIIGEGEIALYYVDYDGEVIREDLL